MLYMHESHSKKNKIGLYLEITVMDFLAIASAVFIRFLPTETNAVKLFNVPIRAEKFLSVNAPESFATFLMG